MPNVSLVIPTRNRAALLRRAIESAQAAGSHVEIIVVDDASTDNTADFCSSLPHIKYKRFTRNQGLSAARNAGVLNSSGEFVAFLDDDDLRLPETLDAQVQALQRDSNAALCYGRCLLADANRQLPTGEIYPDEIATGDVFWKLLELNFIPMPTVVTRKAALIQAGLFNPQLSLVEDWDMWLRLSEHYPVTAVAEPVAIYRQAANGSAQMSRDASALYQAQANVQALALKLPRAQAASGSRRRSVRRKLMASARLAMLHHATSALAKGDKRAARQNIRQAFRFRPFRTLVSGRSWRLLAGEGAGAI